MRIIVPNLNEHDFQFDTWPNPTEVQEIIGRSLAYLVGYDRSSEQLRFVEVDAQGRLFISEEATPRSTGRNVSINVTSSVTAIRGQNTDRARIILQNNGINTIFIGFDVTLSTSNGFPLQPGDNIEFPEYIGAIMGITAGTTENIRYLEIE